MAVEMDVAAAVAQLGAAGVIGWMWLSERRGAVERERELRESHAVVMGQRESIAALVELVRDATRVMAGLEAQQRRMEVVIERVGTVPKGGQHRGTEAHRGAQNEEGIKASRDQGIQ